jgi:hypothetical protein
LPVSFGGGLHLCTVGHDLCVLGTGGTSSGKLQLYVLFDSLTFD